MDLQILDNIIERDDVISLESLLIELSGIYSDINISNDKLFLYKNKLTKLFKDTDSKTHKFLQNLSLKYFKYPSFQLDIFNYIISYKNDNKVPLYKNILNYIKDIYIKNKNNCESKLSLKNSITIICSGNYPKYVFEDFLSIYRNNSDNSLSHQLERFMVNAIEKSNTQIILLLMEKNVNFWFVISTIPDSSINLFDYRNHNYQKNLKNIIKNKINLYDNKYLIVKITGILWNNGQYNLLKLFYNNNNLGDWDKSWYFGYLLVRNMDFENTKKWCKNIKDFDVDSWFDILDSVWKVEENYEYHKNVYKLYDLLLSKCPYKGEILQMINLQNTTLVDKISIIPGAKKLLVKFQEYIIDWDNLNHIQLGNGWTPLLNAARYSDFSTFHYLYHKSNLKTAETLYPSIKDTIFDILSSSFHNPDERVYKFIINDSNNLDDDNIEIFKKNLSNCINGIASRKIPVRYKKKRLLYLNNFIPLNDLINNVIEKILCPTNYDEEIDSNVYEKDINEFEWIIDNFPIQNILPNYIIDYLQKKKDFTNSIEIFINKGYNLLKLLEYCLSQFEWENEIIQNILLYLPDLDCLSLNNQNYILSGLLKKWIKTFRYSYSKDNKSRYYYPNEENIEKVNKIETIISLLISKNFDFQQIRISLDIEQQVWTPLKIVNYLLIGYNSNATFYIVNLLLKKGLFLKCLDMNQIRNHYDMNKIKDILIVLKFLNMCIIKRKIKYKKQFEKRYKPLLVDLLNHPGMDNNILRNGGMEWRKVQLEFGHTFSTHNHKNPEHLNPINLAYLLNCNNLVISEKADGITKTKLPQYIEPEIGIELQNIEAEYIKDLDIYMVFNVCSIQCSVENVINRKITPFMKNQWLRKIHPFTSLNIMEENFTIENLYEERENFKKFLHFERIIKDNKNTLWYPKKVWKIQKQDIINVFSSIEKLYEDCPHPSDGWIITPDKGPIVKIKPFEHLSVDLLFENNNCSTKENIINYVYTQNNNIQEGIWRCYWNNTYSCWEPKEFRSEKKIPNNDEIENFLKYQHINKWKVYDNYQDNNIYYQLKKNKNINKITKHFLNSQKKIHNYFENNIQGECLDIGCGNAKYLNKCNAKYWLGLDIDLTKLSEVKYNNRKKCEILYFDISKNWEIKEEYNYQNYNKLFYRKFDNIIINFALNYCIKENKLSKILNHINKISHSNTKLYINFLDGDKLKENISFENYKKIYFDKSFIQKIDDNYLEIYFEWVHEKPIKELILSGKEIKQIIESLDWNSENYYNIQRIDNCWGEYQNLLSYFKFTKK